MSLEQALKENTEALRALHAVLSSGATLSADQPATTDQPGTGYKILEGDEPGTRYWVIEKNNTVYKQGPTDKNPDPAVIDGAKIVSADEYLAKKAAFEAAAKKPTKGKDTKSTPAASPSPAPAASPAASTASSDKPAHTEVTNQALFATLAKAAGKGPESGKDALRALIKEEGVAKLPELHVKYKGKEAELAAKIQALIDADAAPAEESGDGLDDLGL